MIDLFIGCVRVSSDVQARDGYSAGDQESELRRLGQSVGAKKVIILTDDITGSRPIRQRPGGKELYKYIDAKTPNLAVAWFKVSRVARDVDLIEMPLLMRDLRLIDAQFYICDRGLINLDDLFTKALLILESASSAKDNRDRIDFTMRGRRAKAESGKIVGVGRPPYCHDRVGERKALDYVINKDRAARIREVKRWLLQKRWTVNRCCEELTARGVPTPGALMGDPGKCWYESTMQRVLRSRSLIGRFKHGDIEVVRDDLRIFSDKEFADIDAALERNKIVNPRNAKRPYLLKSILFCKCGMRMIGRYGDGKAHYYYCPSRNANRGRSWCGQGYVRADGENGAEAQVWREVCAFITDEKQLRLAVEQKQREDLKRYEPLEQDIQHAEAEAKKARIKGERLYGALGMATENAVPVIQVQIAQAANELAEHEARANDLRRELNKPSQAIDTEAVIKQARAIAKKIRAAKGAVQREYLHELGVEVQMLDTGKQGEDRRATVTLTALVNTVAFKLTL